MSRKQVKTRAPNRLPASYKGRRSKPLIDALIAFRLSRATQEHFYEVLGALMIAEQITELVARHRGLIVEIRPALDALDTIHQRQSQRTVKDAYWAASPEEVDAVELAVHIYTAMLGATPGPVVLRAMRRITNGIDVTLKGKSDGRTHPTTPPGRRVDRE